jgi:hypothetical protein
VQQWIVEQSELITPERILSEPNQEVRRVMVEQMPGAWPAFVTAAKLKLLDECPDPGNSPQTVRLYSLPAQLGSHKLIIVHNASLSRDGSRRTYGITVRSDCRTALEAVASTFGVTAKEYAAIGRAT